MPGSPQTNDVLNRLFVTLYRSLPMYLEYASPWTHRGDGGQAAPPQLVEGRARPRASRAAQEVDAPGFRFVVKAEEIAAEAAVVGLSHSKHGIRSHGRIDHVTAGFERLHARQRGERVTGGDHAVPSHGRLPMRVADLGH